MAPTEGRVAKPERRWGCRRGTPSPERGMVGIRHNCAVLITIKLFDWSKAVCYWVETLEWV